ncbi:MAG: hypothetical protein EA365_06620 [Gloeocapsa sp. DLM2.Bin57]|nr:MAG: hypothetical protein EA365_06620 [Gloeocapsa sp. DLM2.Bin57]
MTVTEEFKIAVKTGRLKEAFLILLSQSFAVRITTNIGEEIQLETSINVVEGKINNQIDQAFLSYPQHNLVEKFHYEQVNLAPELLREYVKNWYYLSEFLSQGENISPTPALNPDIEVLPAETPAKQEEWSEFLNEVETIEVVNKEESDNEDWGDWMEEDEDWQNNQ